MALTRVSSSRGSDTRELFKQHFAPHCKLINKVGIHNMWSEFLNKHCEHPFSSGTFHIEIFNKPQALSCRRSNSNLEPSFVFLFCFIIIVYCIFYYRFYFILCLYYTFYCFIMCFNYFIVLCFIFVLSRFYYYYICVLLLLIIKYFY